MRYEPIGPDLFVENRRRFTGSLPSGALCIVHSNDIAATNGDGVRSFIQDSNLFWLTGIDQEETILILFPDSRVPGHREMLFVRKTDARLATWEGQKLSKGEAARISGIQQVFWTSSFDGLLKRVMAAGEDVYIPVDHHPGRQAEPASRNQRFAERCKTSFPLHAFHNAAPLLHRLRMIKLPQEIGLMRRAVEITRHAFIAACNVVAHGIFEYEIEAECAREILRRGARGFAYEPIIASGGRSCILHYTANDRQCLRGDILLMDVGASYANYAADMTRTIPVGKTFSARQRSVYEAVLRLLRGATALMQPGALPADYHAAVNEMMDEELVGLGLISMHDIKTQDPARPARTQYVLHRTTHFLGLDVHDPGDVHLAFAPGMVMTCEPGIYIPDEDLGVRLENNILITPDGHEDLMAAIPLEVDEIESLRAT